MISRIANRALGIAGRAGVNNISLGAMERAVKGAMIGMGTAAAGQIMSNVATGRDFSSNLPGAMFMGGLAGGAIGGYWNQLQGLTRGSKPRPTNAGPLPNLGSRRYDAVNRVRGRVGAMMGRATSRGWSRVGAQANAMMNSGAYAERLMGPTRIVQTNPLFGGALTTTNPLVAGRPSPIGVGITRRGGRTSRPRGGNALFGG